MKCLVLYPYPPEADGQSLQGHYLYKGLVHHGVKATPCHFMESVQKEFYLKHLKPDVSFGVGFWGNVPEVIRDPLKYRVRPVPWFNADGWVANYHTDFESLELMFTTSEWVKSLYKRDGVDVSKIVPAHIGIDTDLFRPIKDKETNMELRRMLGVKDYEKMIFTAGGDVTSKGAQEMFYALAQINKEFKDWRYVCKSWPSDHSAEWHEKEERLLEDLGILDKVIFIDDQWSPEFVASVMNACDIYTSPSRIEGFGMFQVEAMACAKPVISINKGGPAETIIHGKTGFLARVADEVKLEEEWAYPSMGFATKHIIKFNEPKTFAYRADIDDLREFTLKLLTEPILAEKMGEAGREHAVQHFDYRITSKKMLDVTRNRLGLE
jgi:glycosyltransferase involved in cell wall biosynthesis